MSEAKFTFNTPNFKDALIKQSERGPVVFILMGLRESIRQLNKLYTVPK